MNQTYKIKKAFVVPFMIAVALLFVLLIVSLIDGPNWERLLLAVLFVAMLAVAAESREREFTVSETGLSIRKFFRTKNFTWAEITHLGVVVMRNKAYFLLTTTRGFYMFSNLLDDHSRLVRFIAEKLGDEKVEPEIKTYLEHSIERKSLMVLSWVVVMILVAIIATKLIKLS